MQLLPTTICLNFPLGLYRVSYLRVCKMNLFCEKEGGKPSYISLYICYLWKCTLMYLYSFHSQFRPFALYGPIFLKALIYIKIRRFQKPLKTVICMEIDILVIFKHSMWPKSFKNTHFDFKNAASLGVCSTVKLIIIAILVGSLHSGRLKTIKIRN